MKITVDTNFFVSATQWDNSVAYRLLMRLIELNTQIFTTKEILNEFITVLQRYFKYNTKEIDTIIEKIIAFVTLVESTEKVDIIQKDPTDNKILECAIASSSKYILTYDKHLLDLKEFREIKILTPEELLRII